MVECGLKTVQCRRPCFSIFTVLCDFSSHLPRADDWHLMPVWWSPGSSGPIWTLFSLPCSAVSSTPWSCMPEKPQPYFLMGMDRVFSLVCCFTMWSSSCLLEQTWVFSLGHLSSVLPQGNYWLEVHFFFFSHWDANPPWSCCSACVSLCRPAGHRWKVTRKLASVGAHQHSNHTSVSAPCGKFQ